jgi:hypothetical protein
VKIGHIAKKTGQLVFASSTKISTIFFAGIAMTVAGGLVTAITHSGPGGSVSDERFPASVGEAVGENASRPARQLITPPFPTSNLMSSRAGSEAANDMANQLARAAEDQAAQNANAPQPEPVMVTNDAPVFNSAARANPGQQTLQGEDRTTGTSTSTGTSTGTAPNTNGYGGSVNSASSTDTSTATEVPGFNPAAPTNLTLVTSEAGWAGVCQKATITIVDFTGNPQGALSPLTVALGTDQGSFYSAAGCTTAASSLGFNTGSSVGTAYFKASATANVSASEGTLGESNSTVTIGIPVTSFTLGAAGAPATGVTAPNGILRIGNKLVVADVSNNRVLIWNSIPTSSAQHADIVLGQPDLLTTAANPMGVVSATSLSGPTAVASDGTRLAVVDAGNHRVLLWDSFPTSTQVAATHVVGQATMAAGSANRGGGAVAAAGTLSSPSCAAFSSGALFVCDKGNNRVLGWNSVPTSDGVSATFAVGQANLTAAASGSALTQLSSPADAVAANGRLYVTDSGNDRLLIWASVPAASGSTAAFSLGQAEGSPSATSLSSPARVRADQNGRILVSDSGNHRILVWNKMPNVSGTAADGVIGQANLTSNSAGATTSSLDGPTGIEVSGSELWISDTINNRVLQFTLP